MTDWVSDITNYLRDDSEWTGKVFAYQLPENAPNDSALIVPPLEGLPVDLEYPHRYEGIFQAIIRTNSLATAHTLGVDVLKKLTLRNVTVGGMTVVRSKPSNTPVVYPKSDSDQFEASVTFDIIIIDNRIST